MTTPAAAPVPAVTLLDGEVFDQAIAAADDDAAWSALLADWRLPSTSSDRAIARQCAAQLADGVHCLRARGHLDQLVAIGRPVLLPLQSDGAASWAVLRGSDARVARLELGAATVDVPRTLLQQAWNGSYVAIWRDTGAAAPVDDLRAFQALHGLAVDGIAGPQTRFALSAEGPGPEMQALP